MSIFRFTASIILASIALLFSWIPAYGANLIISLPAGLIAYWLYRSGAETWRGRWFAKIPLIILLTAAVAFVGSWLLVI